MKDHAPFAIITALLFAWVVGSSMTLPLPAVATILAISGTMLCLTTRARAREAARREDGGQPSASDDGGAGAQSAVCARGPPRAALSTQREV